MKFTGRVGVFGGREVEPDLYKETIEIGRRLAKANFLVFCGGTNGVMEAIAKGVSENDGTIIGILKGMNPEEGNEYLTIPIATNMGMGRNPLITYNCDIGLAIGGKNGTLSEIAYMLQLDKPIIGYKSWIIDGMDQALSIDDIFAKINSYSYG